MYKIYRRKNYKNSAEQNQRTKWMERYWISLMVQWLRITCQCKEHGFSLRSGKIPHVTETNYKPEHHGYRAHTLESTSCNYWGLSASQSMLCNKRGHHKFSPVAQSCPTPCDPMNCSSSGLPVHYQLPESTQTHVHCVSDAIQPSHPLLPSSAFNLSQH